MLPGAAIASVAGMTSGTLLPLMQKLETGMADLVCLDGRRITSKGITSGSNSFRVTPLAEAVCCFGSSAQAGAATADGLQQQVKYHIVTAGLPCADGCNEIMAVHTSVITELLQVIY